MAISFVDDLATISTSEYSLPADTTTGVPTSQTDDCALQVYLDFGAMQTGDEYQIKIYEKAGSTQRLAIPPVNLVGAQTSLWISPMLLVGTGWDVTVKKIGGTDRSIVWSLRKLT